MTGGFDAYLDDEAIHWVAELPGVESIVFGASSAGNIRGTKALVEKYMSKEREGRIENDKDLTQV